MMRELILVVEDDADIRQTLAEGLELYGFRVRQAKNGIEGLQACAEESPRLMLLDCRMPLLDGPSLVRELRESGRSISFIIMTADPAAFAIADELGAIACFRKPFDFGELMSSIQHALKAA